MLGSRFLDPICANDCRTQEPMEFWLIFFKDHSSSAKCYCHLLLNGQIWLFAALWQCWLSGLALCTGCCWKIVPFIKSIISRGQSAVEKNCGEARCLLCHTPKTKCSIHSSPWALIPLICFIKILKNGTTSRNAVLTLPQAMPHRPQPVSRSKLKTSAWPAADWRSFHHGQHGQKFMLTSHGNSPKSTTRSCPFCLKPWLPSPQ